MRRRHLLPHCRHCGSMTIRRDTAVWVHYDQILHLYRPVCIDCGSEGDLIAVPSSSLFPITKEPFPSLMHRLSAEVINFPRNRSTTRFAARPNVVVPFAPSAAT